MKRTAGPPATELTISPSRVGDNEPPHSSDAERELLGWLLLDPAPRLATVRSGLHATDFYHTNHRIIYEAMLRLGARGLDATTMAVATDLERLGDLERAGGREYLGTLFDFGLTFVRAESAEVSGATHAQLVTELAVRRQALAFLKKTEQGVRDGAPLQDIATALRTGGEAVGMEAGSGRGALHFLDDQAIQELPAQEYVIAQYLPALALAEMHGPPGAGKSFLALHWALSVARGADVHCSAVRRGPVVYVAAEGSAALGKRIAAWQHYHGYSGLIGVHFLTQPVQLLDPVQVDRFIAAVRARLGNIRPQMIVLDTLARCLVGGDENSAKDMGLAVGAADRIRAELGATVLLLHHTRKDGESERGSTALRGGVDTMIGLKLEDDLLAVSCEKQKDAAPFPRLNLTLIPVLGSCVIGAKSHGTYGSSLTGVGTSKQREALEALHLSFGTSRASASNWLEASGQPRSTFFRTATALTALTYVKRIEVGRSTFYQITEAGIETIGAKSQRGTNEVPTGAGVQVPAVFPPLGERRHGTNGTDGTAVAR